MKRLIVFAAVLLGVVVGGGPVAAAPPGPADVTFINRDCGFRIEATVTGGSGVNELPGGAAIITAPNQRVTLTNVRTGESVTYVITGATHIDTSDPGLLTVTSTGRNVLIVPEGDREGLYLTQGTVTFVLDGKGRQVSAFEGPGQVADICALLA
ncbi:hypothetical protein [Arthrobacter sp. ISL-65]|uniref:hypothetical protein n=1 Tax=Arthrobacter sp. ISL-65 TaxID=2819112 RepID=UPI001BE7EC0A|nr:hypothetical protein [Arthrobacter sp. ISL-65]MBT2551235.1 hypothetical protein [Arthrobacter sp. ISL-65]